MSKHSENRQVEVLGIDLAKSSFQVHGVDGRGCKVVSRKLGRPKLRQYLVNLPACVVAMEACAGAHYWARLVRSYGHEAKLIAPQFGQSKLGYKTPAFLDLADIDITHVCQLPCLHVQIAI